MIQIFFENIPNELKHKKQWVLWKLESIHGKKTKVPYQVNGLKASSTDPNTWTDFKTAMGFAQKLGCGIGFVFTKESGFIGIDFDHVLENRIIVKEKVKELITNLFNSYTEISPSGNGLHVIIKSKLPDNISNVNNNYNMEIYDTSRYFTFTGNIYHSLKQIREIDSENLKVLFENKKFEKETKTLPNSKPNENQIKELNLILEENWDLDKPESEGNHHQIALTVIFYFKEAGYDKEWSREFFTNFTETHPCKDGIIHPVKDLNDLIDYVFDHNYDKVAPEGSVSKEFKHKLWYIINNETDLSKLKNIREEVVEYISQTVKEEKPNIKKIMNVCLSAYTPEPNNLALVDQTTTGKTFLVENIVNIFPSENVIKLRKVSPKSFNHEHGTHVLKVNTEKGAEYLGVIKNRFTNKDERVGAYLSFLNRELKDKKSELNKDDVLNELYRIQSSLYTQIDFENKILVLLDRPPIEFWSDMLTVASHDSFYQEGQFTESSGNQFYTKHIVYKGWPAIIFCTSNDKDFTWQDLETRFEILQPNNSTEKYTQAVDESLNKEYGIEISRDKELLEIKKKVNSLVQYLKSHKPKPYLPNTKEIRKALIGDAVERADLMRKFPRIVKHIGLNTLWNIENRVIFKSEKDERLLVNAEDIREIENEFTENELNATLNGFKESDYEFFTEILIPACTTLKEDQEIFEPVKQSEICKALQNYKGKLGKTKMACSRYLKSLEDRNLIKREKIEEDKRGFIVIPLIEELQKFISQKESIEKLVTSMKVHVPESIEYFINEHYTAFCGGVKLVTHMGENAIKNDFLNSLEFSESISNTLTLIDEIIAKTDYSYTFWGSDVTNFNVSNNSDKSISNKQFPEIQKNETLQKPRTFIAVTNFFKDTYKNKDENYQEDNINSDDKIFIVLIKDKDFSDVNRDYTGHKGDVFNLDRDLAELLIKDGFAEKMLEQEHIQEFYNKQSAKEAQ